MTPKTSSIGLTVSIVFGVDRVRILLLHVLGDDKGNPRRGQVRGEDGDRLSTAVGVFVRAVRRAQI